MGGGWSAPPTGLPWRFLSALKTRYFFRLGNNAPTASRAHAVNPASHPPPAVFRSRRNALAAPVDCGKVYRVEHDGDALERTWTHPEGASET